MVKDNLCTCNTCGWQWVRGHNGNHNCTPLLSEKIASLQKENEKLSQSAKDLRELRDGDRKLITSLEEMNKLDYDGRKIAEAELAIANRRLQAVREAVT